MKTTILVPRLSSNDDIMLVLKWYVKNKTLVQKGDELILFETSKVAIDVHCENTGYILQHCKEGENVSVGSLLVSIYTELAELEEDLNKGADLMQANDFNKILYEALNARFTEPARKYIIENNIDPKQFEHLDLVTVKIVKETEEMKNVKVSL